MLAKTIVVATTSEVSAAALCDCVMAAGYETSIVVDREQALEWARSTDCMVLDWDAGEDFGSSLLASLRDTGATAPVVILAHPLNMRSALRGLKMGAADLLEKPAPAAELRSAIEQAILRAARSSKLMQEIAQARHVLSQLSPREQQFVAGVVAGLTSREIADAAAISVRTVETSRTRLLGKLGVPNTAALVRLAVLGGLAPLERQPQDA